MLGGVALLDLDLCLRRTGDLERDLELERDRDLDKLLRDVRLVLLGGGLTGDLDRERDLDLQDSMRHLPVWIMFGNYQCANFEMNCEPKVF